MNVPQGYDENKPGRPKSVTSIIGTDNSRFGRDPIGQAAYSKNAETGEDDMKVDYKGGSPLALESTMGEFLKNKRSLDRMISKNQSRKVKLFEEPDLLSENNIIDGLD